MCVGLLITGTKLNNVVGLYHVFLWGVMPIYLFWETRTIVKQGVVGVKY